MYYKNAVKEIAKEGLYLSADFYRMIGAKSIALGLQDKAPYILADIANHGSEHAKSLLQDCIEKGIVSVAHEDCHTFYDIVMEEEIHGLPYQFKSHVAMQIAYPERYWQFYHNEHVWSYSHPKMQYLLELCFKCLTDSTDCSDFDGEQEITEEGVKPVEKVKTGHNEWILACQHYKKATADAWVAYIEACTARKNNTVALDEWLASEISPLQKQIKELKAMHVEKLQGLTNKVQETHTAHSKLKAIGKPLKSQFT